MIGGCLVIDAVAHAYNVDPANFMDNGMGAVAGKIAYDVHVQISDRSDPRWLLAPEQFMRKCDPEMLAWALFAESQTDYACYHETPLFGFFKDGGSPRELGREVKALTGDRVWSYGAVQPWDAAAALEHLDRQVEEDGIVGIKFYPSDLWKGELRRLRFDDEQVAFPIFEHARRRGIKSIAIHKAVAFGATPLEDFNVHDVEVAARAFPDLQFEIVHGGWAFLDDTAMLAEYIPNVWVNLEATTGFLNFAPVRFAHVMGRLLAGGAEDRILWATGAMATHPQPLVAKFWDYEIPADLVGGYGYPPLTEAVKRKILGGNFARLHGFDVATLVEGRPRDALRQAQEEGLAAPWSHAPAVSGSA